MLADIYHPRAGKGKGMVSQSLHWEMNTQMRPATGKKPISIANWVSYHTVRNPKSDQRFVAYEFLHKKETVEQLSKFHRVG